MMLQSWVKTPLKNLPATRTERDKLRYSANNCVSNYTCHPHVPSDTIRMLRIVLLIAACLKVSAQIPCDDVYGASCPEVSGWAVGDCVKEAGGFSDECADYMHMSEECRDDINSVCKDMAYTGDLLSCLTEWNKPENLSEKCVAALPKPKPPPAERKKTKEEKAKANKRKRARAKAAQEARDMGL